MLPMCYLPGVPKETSKGGIVIGLVWQEERMAQGLPTSNSGTRTQTPGVWPPPALLETPPCQLRMITSKQ